jgi:putative ABC transport system permease protein
MIWRLVSRSIRQRPQRFALGVLSVAMGTAVAVAFAGVSLALGDRLARTLRAYGANIVLVPEGSALGIQLEGTDYRPPLRTGALRDSSLASLHRTFWRNNILGYAPQLAAAARVGRDGEPPRVAASVVGTWFDREITTPDGFAFHAGMRTVAPWWRVRGRLPYEPQGTIKPARAENSAPKSDDLPEALAGVALARRAGIAAGDEVRVLLEGRVHSARVTGVLDAGGVEDQALHVPIEVLQSWQGRPGEVGWVLVSALIKPGFPPAPDAARDPAAFERWACTPYVTSVAHDLDRMVPGAEARPVRQIVEAEGRVVHRLNRLLLLLSLAALTGAALGVTSTMAASVVERRSEFALQRALGASPAALLAPLAVETCALGVLGGVAGSALGLGLAWLAGRAAFDVTVPPHPLVLPVGLVCALAVAAAGSWIPVRWVTRVVPAAGLRA